MSQRAQQFDNPLDLERFVGSLLGRIWERRLLLGADEQPRYALVLGSPIVASIAEHGGAGAPTLLRAIESLERGALARHAGQLARGLPRVGVPDWIEQVGTAEVTRAFSASSPGEGEAILLEACTGARGNTTAVFIDGRLGGIVKHIGLLEPVDAVTEGHVGPRSRIAWAPADPVLACRRVRLAIDATDSMPHPPVADTYAELRAIAAARAGSLE